MQDETFHIPFNHEVEGLHTVSLKVRELEEDYLLWCNLPTTDESLSSQASDCFAALQILRSQAEDRGWHICCNGARVNVWPSGMCRDMGGGFKAYVLTMGEPARIELMVNVLDPDAPDSYCSVAEQELFANRWFDSLG